MSVTPGTYSIGDISLPNPLVIASCPATEDAARLLRCAEAGAAAAILKSCHAPEHLPTDWGWRRFRQSMRGLWGTSAISRELAHPEHALRIMRDVIGRTGMVLVPSIACFSLESSGWLDALELFADAGARLVQLDLFYLQEDLSLPSSQARLRELILFLRQRCSVGLLPKLNQELRPGAAAAVTRNTGIAGLSLLDSVRGHFAVAESSHHKDFPRFLHAGGLDCASLFGPWQLPLTCEYVYRLRRETDFSIVAGGGVEDADDIIHLLALGADAVQVATVVLREGPGWIKNTLTILEPVRREINRNDAVFFAAHAYIDHEACPACGRCAEQLMCAAIHMNCGKPEIDHHKCEGCGFCVSICPAGAITVARAELSQNSAITTS